MAELTILKAEKPKQCAFCGEVRELRPYGPRGEEICFPCGMKDEGAARRAFRSRLGDTSN